MTRTADFFQKFFVLFFSFFVFTFEYKTPPKYGYIWSDEIVCALTSRLVWLYMVRRDCMCLNISFGLVIYGQMRLYVP